MAEKTTIFRFIKFYWFLLIFFLLLGIILFFWQYSFAKEISEFWMGAASFSFSFVFFILGILALVNQDLKARQGELKEIPLLAVLPFLLGIVLFAGGCIVVAAPQSSLSNHLLKNIRTDVGRTGLSAGITILPATVKYGESVDVTIEIKNPNKKLIRFDELSLFFRDRFFEGTVMVFPTKEYVKSITSNIITIKGGEIKPGQQIRYQFRVVAVKPGDYSGTIEIFATMSKSSGYRGFIDSSQEIQFSIIP